MIPLPREIVFTGGQLQLARELEFSAFPNSSLAEELSGYWETLHKQYPGLLPEGHTQVRCHSFAALPAAHREMHALLITDTGITISAKSDAGFRYGLQSLKQLLFQAVTQDRGQIGKQNIIDYPEYDWRGLHLDESRHFFGMKTVKRYLKWMAVLKLNRFHWHLTDDQGWRIESKCFPLLTNIGAYRREADGSVYGGFYSQDEIREVVAYARSLGIEVIPEIDLPGHSLAMLAAYPSLACFPGEFSPLSTWGISEDILCPGKDESLAFLEELLGEMAELFDGQYFHLGGDEAPKSRWKRCPLCQARIKSQSLAGEEELQSWLISRLVARLEACGKQLIGWDEILDGSLDAGPIVMVWRGDGKDAAHKASENGNRFILCPNRICYFDWKAAPDLPGAHGISSLENVYFWEPARYGRKELCLGGQANLWTEYIHTHQELKQMLFPRVFALSERLWNNKPNYSDFLKRESNMEHYFETLP